MGYWSAKRSRRPIVGYRIGARVYHQRWKYGKIVRFHDTIKSAEILFDDGTTRIVRRSFIKTL